MGGLAYGKAYDLNTTIVILKQLLLNKLSISNLKI